MADGMKMMTMMIYLVLHQEQVAAIHLTTHLEDIHITEENIHLP
jgi:hypothetical protein